MSRFDEAIQQMKENRKKTAEKIGLFLEAEAKSRVSVDTGHTRRSITHETEHEDNKSTIFVGTNNVEYAPALEEGSKPHTINYGKPQKLKIDGRWVTVKKIHHPGTKPQPFIKPSISENMNDIQKMIQEGMSVDA